MLKEFITEIILNEDFDSFASDIKHSSRLRKGYELGDESDPLFVFTKESDKKPAIELKQLWSKNVDRQFIQSLTKVHYLWRENYKKFPQLKKLLKMSKKDELSCCGFLPNQKLNGDLYIGVVVKGWVTFAGNDMDKVWSGYHGQFVFPDDREKFKNSGIPKRPMMSIPYSGMSKSKRQKFHPYIFDEQTFNKDLAQNGQNELIVDNWKPLAIMLTAEKYDMLWYGDNEGYPVHENQIMRAFLDIIGNLPVVDENMQQWNMNEYDERLK